MRAYNALLKSYQTPFRKRFPNILACCMLQIPSSHMCHKISVDDLLNLCKVFFFEDLEWVIVSENDIRKASSQSTETAQ